MDHRHYRSSRLRNWLAMLLMAIAVLVAGQSHAWSASRTATRACHIAT